MEKALATYRNGHVEFDQAVNWPDGTRLEIVPAVHTIGLAESEWPKTQAEKDEWLEWLKNLEPFDMSPEELEVFEKELRGFKEAHKQLLRESWRAEGNP